jgi:hypothetical protein
MARNHLDAGEASEALDACRGGLKAHPHFAELMMEEGRSLPHQGSVRQVALATSTIYI